MKVHPSNRYVPVGEPASEGAIGFARQVDFFTAPGCCDEGGCNFDERRVAMVNMQILSR
jgi:hypothetical protein